jgi:SAM-dependent methyltransferase
VSEDLRDKYDRLAGSYTSRYADPDAIARFYVDLVSTWGPSAGPGSTVLELGCADGFMTEALLHAGFVVTALDLSPRMIDAARERLAHRRDVELEIADVATFDPAGRTWDVVLGAMWTFFAYVEDPEAVLNRLGAATQRKLIVDRNPRTHPLDAAESTFLRAGFCTPETRPVTVPLSRRSTAATRAAGRAVSAVGPVWRSVIRRKFNVAILAVPDDPGTS